MTFYGFKSFYFTLSRMDALCAGAFLAYQLHLKNDVYYVNWGKYITIGVPLIIGYSLLWLAFSGEGNFLVQIIKDSGYYIIYYILLLLVVSSNDNLIQNSIKKLFSNSFLVYIEKISFGLYVYHQMCYRFIGKFEIENLSLSLLLCMGLSVIIATISFYCFENLILKFKDRFSYS